MEIIIEKAERISEKNINKFVSRVKDIEILFISMYGKYLEEDELKLVRDVIYSRKYYIAFKEGKKTVEKINFNVEKNSYKMDDYKFIDTRVYTIENNLTIINLSNIESLEESQHSILCSLMHEILHIVSNIKMQAYY